jgi:hypothetical protein
MEISRNRDTAAMGDLGSSPIDTSRRHRLVKLLTVVNSGKRACGDADLSVVVDDGGNGSLSPSIGDLLDKGALASGNECYIATDGLGNILLVCVS